MPSPFSEFYSGGMLAPNRVGDTLVPAQIYSQPTSVSDMYKGIYADAPPRSSAYDPVGLGGDYGALTGMLDDPIYGGSSPTRVAASGSTNIPHANGSVAFDKGQDQLQGGNLLAFGMPAGPKMNAGVAAIERAAPRSIADLFGGSAFAGSALGGMDWSPAVTGTGPEWSQADRHLSPAPSHPGLVTGSRTTVAPPPPQPGIADMFAAATSGSPYAGTSYLNAQGVDTSGMTAGQIGNAFNDSVRGAGHGEWH